MAFCANCGAQAPGKFCPNCGATIAAAGPPGAAPEAPGPAAGAAPAAGYTPPPAAGYPPPGAGYQPPPPGYQPPPPGYQPQPGGYQPVQAQSGLQENVAGALCYLAGFVTGILFLVLAPYNQNPRVRFHAFQSIFFNVAWIIFWIAVNIVSFALPWGLHLIVSLLSLVVGFGGFILWLLLMFKAYNNTPLVLPVIGPMAQSQAGPGSV